MKIRAFLSLIRVRHWVKNVIVFSPLFFSGEIKSMESETFLLVFLTFLSFSFVSSSIYILNDLKDVEKDKLHPTKCNRPIASGIFSRKEAIVLFIFVFTIGLLYMFFLEAAVISMILSYFVLNILYIYYTKNISIVDVTSISLGFVLRLVAGGIVAGVLITHWIIITTFLLMLSIALAKRRDDLILSAQTNESYRKSQSGYNLQFVDTAMIISFSITMMTYILYSVSADVIQRLGSNYIYITALPVILGILRYLQLAIVEKKTGSPVKLLFSDNLLKIFILVWLVVFYVWIYG